MTAGSVHGRPHSDRRLASVVVGNSPAGDLSADCDVLDPGDGSELVPVLLAGGNIEIRKGDYNLGLGSSPSIADGIVLPANTHITGAGIGLTRILSPTVGDQRIIQFGGALGDFLNIRDLSFVLQDGDGAGTADSLVAFGNHNSFLSSVELVPAPALDPTLTAVRFVLDVTGAHVRDVLIGTLFAPWPSFQAATASDLIGLRAGATTNEWAMLARCVVRGGDVCYRLLGTMADKCDGLPGDGGAPAPADSRSFELDEVTRLSQCTAAFFGAAGYRLSNLDNHLAQCLANGSQFEESVAYDFLAGSKKNGLVDCRGTDVQIGAQFAESSDNHIIACQLEPNVPAVSNTAVLIDTASNDNHIDRNYLDGDIGVDIEGGALRTKIGHNTYGPTVAQKVFISNPADRVIQEVYTSTTNVKTAANTGGTYQSEDGERVLYDATAGTFTVAAPVAPIAGPSPGHGAVFRVKNTTTDVTAITIDGDADGFGSLIEDPQTGTFVANFTVGISLFSGEWVYSVNTSTWYFTAS